MAKWNAAADEQRFREDVAIGDRWVKRVADQLRTTGLFAVQVPEVQVRGAFEDRRAFRDDGDLFVNGHRVEVRSFGFKFTSQRDFPRRSVQVELASVADHKANARAYLFVSRATGAVVGLVGGDCRRTERQNGVWNERRGVARDWMVAPAERLRDWPQVVEYLAQLGMA